MNNQSGKFGYLKNVIILDTGSILSATFMNPGLVTNIRVNNKPITMQTNDGYIKIVLEGQVVDQIKARFGLSHIANIFGFIHMTDKYRSTYNSDKEDAFIMHTYNGIIKFRRTPEGLYSYKQSASYLKQVVETKYMSPPTETSGSQLSNMVSTMPENCKGCTQHQFENSKRARRLYHIIGFPIIENFKHILQQNNIRN